MPSLMEQLEDNFAKLSPEERADLQRVARGEDQDDLIRRGDVYDLIRSMRTNPVPSIEFQKALSAVQKAVCKLEKKA